MESSKSFGEAEECHSCESGWTMYIGSPAEEEAGVDDGGELVDGEDGRQENSELCRRGCGGGGGGGDDSDDSMASDATSGPSHQPATHGRANHSGAHCKNSKEKNKQEASTTPPKKINNNRHETRNQVKESSSSSSFSSRNGNKNGNNKVRKNHWMGARN